MHHFSRNFIGRCRVVLRGGSAVEVVSPFDGSPAGSAPLAGAEDIDPAVAITWQGVSACACETPGISAAAIPDGYSR